MKITNFNPNGIPVALGGWSTGITSLNSNATTTDGGLSAINFVQRITSNGSNILLNPSVNFAAGSNITLAAASNTVTITSTGGSSGAFETVINGGGSTVSAHGNTGSTETFNPAAGNVHTATLDANCTVTLTSPASGPACTIELYLTNDTGARTVTWPGSVVWSGGTAPTLGSSGAASIDRIILETLDGGSTWYGVMVGSGSSLTVKDEGSALATAATSLDFVGAGVVASGTGAAKTITISGGGGTAAFVGAKAFNSATQSIPDVTFTALTFDSEDFDTDAIHSTATNTSRMTIPSGKAGKYLVEATVHHGNNGTGIRYIRIYLNGAVVRGGVNQNDTLANSGGAPFVQHVCTILSLVATDYVEVFVYQNSGGALNAGGANANPEQQNSFSVALLGT